MAGARELVLLGQRVGCGRRRGGGAETAAGWSVVAARPSVVAARQSGAAAVDKWRPGEARARRAGAKVGRMKDQARRSLWGLKKRELWGRLVSPRLLHCTGTAQATARA